MNIKKGDTILVLAGKNKGATGKIEKLITRDKKIIVSGVNVVKKHLKPNAKNPHGGIVDYNAPIHISNAQIICPRCNKTTRIEHKITSQSKLRICKRCHEAIDSK